jgi:redox-sensitive bicupin YhaK (pirin superfamily)
LHSNCLSKASLVFFKPALAIHIRTGTLMITLRPSRDFGSFRLDHFQSLQHFGPESCGGHPMQWGDMIMWNHETISPRAALPQTPHADTEILTYVTSGFLYHEDNLGNVGMLQAGNCQIMSAGTGVFIRRGNPDEAEPVEFVQIWLMPNHQAGEPFSVTNGFADDGEPGQFVTLASGFDNEGNSLPMRANARLSRIVLTDSGTADYRFEAGNFGYVVPLTGAVQVGDVVANRNDGILINDVEVITIVGVGDAEALLIELSEA